MGRWRFAKSRPHRRCNCETRFSAARRGRNAAPPWRTLCCTGLRHRRLPPRRRQVAGRGRCGIARTLCQSVRKRRSAIGKWRRLATVMRGMARQVLRRLAWERQLRRSSEPRPLRPDDRAAFTENVERAASGSDLVLEPRNSVCGRRTSRAARLPIDQSAHPAHIRHTLHRD
jgi:hypothetical protein